MTPPRVFTLRAMGRCVHVRAERGVPEEFLERLRASWADCLEPDDAVPDDVVPDDAEPAGAESAGAERATRADAVFRLVGPDLAPADPASAASADADPAPSSPEGADAPEPACLVVGTESTWPGAEQSFTTLVTTTLLGLLVGRVHLLHAAALTPPEDAGEGPSSALVLVGPSGRGKTTASLALARAGWGYLSDETAVIDPADRSVAPYPKPLSVIEEAGRPKVQRAVGGMGLAVRHRGAPLGGLVLLRRLGPEEDPGGPVPRIEPVPLAEGLQALAEQSSGLERMPDGVVQLVRLVQETGGVRRVLYREAATLDPVLRDLARDPEATAVREPWTRIAEEEGAPRSGPEGRWRRAPETQGIDTEQAALVLRPGHSYVLTRAAADAWLLLECPGRTVTDLRRALERRHGPAPDGAVEDILATLAEGGLIRAPGQSAGPAAVTSPSAEAPRPVEEEPAP